MSLSLRNISHRFGALEALRDVTLDAEGGQIICLFGPSGCGKTTLLRLAAGLENLQQGEIALNGALIAAPGREVPPEKRSVGIVFQDYVLFPHMTVAQNIAFGLARSKGREAKEKVSAQLGAMGLEGLGARFPHELSGGQQQRAALARALIREPAALLLDEPFASIDSALRRRLRDDLRRTLRKQNAAVMLVTHDPEEALAMGDRIALMNRGEVIEIATPRALYETPKTLEGAIIFPGSQLVEGEIKSGSLHTVIGTFPAEGSGDGPGAAVCRAGSISAQRDPNGAFTVTDAQFAGPGWRLRLSARGLSRPLLVEADIQPEVGEKMQVSIRRENLFVFDYNNLQDVA